MKQHQIPILNPKLTIGWLYPELMSTYGDRGNIIVLKKIAEDHNVNVEVLRIDQTTDHESLKSADLIFMGGAQDLQQEIVNADLLSEKGKVLTKKIEDGTPGLYICGAYQFLGNYYKDSYGNEIKGLGVFDMHTESESNKERLIGTIVVKIKESRHKTLDNELLVGFENHGGRTHIKNKNQAFGSVVKGFGNNEEDKTEGIRYKNSIGTYMHGPILPSNPELAVSLLELAIEKKYDKKVELKFEDILARRAKAEVLGKLGIKSQGDL